MRAVLLGLVFLHGVFASGMVPVLNRHLETSAPIAFALYFTGMVLGQLALWRFGPLSRARRSLAAFELLFAAALAYMAVAPAPLGLVSGRFFEGIFSGIVLPLIFAEVVRIERWGSTERRVAWMSSSFAVGFVAGPLVSEALVPHLATGGTLGLFAAVFAAAAIVVALAVPGAPRPAATAPSDEALPAGRWMTLFFPLFASKVTYGYMLALVSGNAHVYLAGVAIPVLMLVLSAIFVAGQVLGTWLVKRTPQSRLLLAAPTLLSVAMAALAIADSFAPLFLVALCHSVLALLGYHNLSRMPDNARRFALYNCLSDPGMILGAIFALEGTAGAWGIAVVGLVPLLRAAWTRPLRTRPAA